ncbi:MAG: hypothetical protein AUJ49_01315 [Desulfovibrionaceae bacterium CG1_02_65_16]|nr:MAG: hypothetical protein AUJ49_01315 [Desulfovibrionaceae bacterium CG1_02_65_16]
MAYVRTFIVYPWALKFVMDFSRPWGCRMHGGRIARLAWCWGQAESRRDFLFFRLLVLGPLGIMVGRITHIGGEG